MTQKSDEITLGWLPSEIPHRSADEMLASLADELRAGVYWESAVRLAKQRGLAAPRFPSQDDHANWRLYLQYVNGLGYSTEDLEATFIQQWKKLDDKLDLQRRNAEEFIRYVESNAFDIEKEVFDKYVNRHSIEFIIDYAVTHSRQIKARRAALKKLGNDPKQADKAQVRECWELWQKEPKRYRWKTTFARDMMEKYPSLESTDVIARWCREWEAEVS